MKICIAIISILLTCGILSAQNANNLPADTTKKKSNGFLLTVNGFVNFEKTSAENILHGSISPVVVWKISEKFFFEGEEEMSVDKNRIKFDVMYATLHWRLNDYVRFGAGKFLSPNGTYQERLHPAWINKFPEAPLGFSHDGILIVPMDEVGVEARGGVPVGSSKINYVVYASNGPELSTASGGMNMGSLVFGNYLDNNWDKAIGGRIGFLPLSNSSLEIGYSRQNARVGYDDDPLYENARVVMHGFDLSYVKAVSPIKSLLDVKGQYNHVMLDRYYDGTSSSSSSSHTSGTSDSYEISKAYYVQVALRPALVQNTFLQKLELAGRFSGVSLPPGMSDASSKHLATVTTEEPSRQNINHWAVGLNYWFSWRTVLKLAWQQTEDAKAKSENIFLVQIAIAHPKINFIKLKQQ